MKTTTLCITLLALTSLAAIASDKPMEERLEYRVLHVNPPENKLDQIQIEARIVGQEQEVKLKLEDGDPPKRGDILRGAAPPELGTAARRRSYFFEEVSDARVLKVRFEAYYPFPNSNLRPGRQYP